MNIQQVITIETCADVDELKGLVEQGDVRIAPMRHDPYAEQQHERYLRLNPKEGQKGAVIRVRKQAFGYLCDILSPTLSINLNNTELTFAPQGLTIDGGRRIKFKYEAGMAYHLQKTQYKGSSAYGLLGVLVDPLWAHVVPNELVKIGYIAAL